jgi:hypothetical protein
MAAVMLVPPAQAHSSGISFSGQEFMKKDQKLHIPRSGAAHINFGEDLRLISRTP